MREQQDGREYETRDLDERVQMRRRRRGLDDERVVTAAAVQVERERLADGHSDAVDGGPGPIAVAADVAPAHDAVVGRRDNGARGGVGAAVALDGQVVVGRVAPAQAAAVDRHRLKVFADVETREFRVRVQDENAGKVRRLPPQRRRRRAVRRPLGPRENKGQRRLDRQRRHPRRHALRARIVSGLALGPALDAVPVHQVQSHRRAFLQARQVDAAHQHGRAARSDAREPLCGVGRGRFPGTVAVVRTVQRFRRRHRPDRHLRKSNGLYVNIRVRSICRLGLF